MKGFVDGPPTPPEDIHVGDICRTRQGRLYYVVSMPGPSRAWRSSSYMYYFTMGPDGTFGRTGQVIYEYAKRNWEVVGHAPFHVGEVTWRK